jgi:hypothetical protein
LIRNQFSFISYHFRWNYFLHHSKQKKAKSFPVVLLKHVQCPETDSFKIQMPSILQSSRDLMIPLSIAQLCRCEVTSTDRGQRCVPGCICKLRELGLNESHRAVPILSPHMLVALFKREALSVDVRNENLQNCACCTPHSHITNR